MVVFAAVRPQDGEEIASKLHNHPYDKLVVVVNGKMEFIVDGESYVLSAGSSMIIPALAMHTGRAIGPELCTTFEVLAPVRREYLPLLEHQAESFVNDGQMWVKATNKSWS
jgi:mannose-6-phosphate isomerase-like protein (cupin superfamily)